MPPKKTRNVGTEKEVGSREAEDGRRETGDRRQTSTGRGELFFTNLFILLSSKAFFLPLGAGKEKRLSSKAKK